MTEHAHEPPRFSDQFRAELHNLFLWRRDVRRFRRTALAQGTLESLVETANLAPSVGLSQPWRFVSVDDVARRKAIAQNFAQCNAQALEAQPHDRALAYARLKLEGLDEAPCHLAVFADRMTEQGHGLGRRTMVETIDYSAALAAHTLWLAARAQGIGVGWVSILDPLQVTAILETPPSWLFIAYLCIGYPALEQDTPTLEREGWEHRRLPGSTLLRR